MQILKIQSTKNVLKSQMRDKGSFQQTQIRKLTHKFQKYCRHERNKVKIKVSCKKIKLQTFLIYRTKCYTKILKHTFMECIFNLNLISLNLIALSNKQAKCARLDSQCKYLAKW